MIIQILKFIEISVESFSIGVETMRSQASTIIQSALRQMSLVSRNSHLVVLYDVLLHYGLSDISTSSLGQSSRVQVGLGQVAIVSWNVTGDFGRSSSQLVVLILHFGRVNVELVPGIVAVGSQRLGVLRVEVGSLGGVSLSWQTPERPFRSLRLFAQVLLSNCLIHGFPVREHLLPVVLSVGGFSLPSRYRLLSSSSEGLSSGSNSPCSKLRSGSSHLLDFSKFAVAEQTRVMSVLVTHHCVSVFVWYLIVSNFNTIR